MATCKLIIEDEVNIKLEGVAVDVRRKSPNVPSLKCPYARYMPNTNLGDGTVKLSLLVLVVLAMLIVLTLLLVYWKRIMSQIADIQDRRHPIKIDPQPNPERYWADLRVRWSKGHSAEGEEIIPRDYPS